MLFFAGGPGNTVPSGLGATGFVRGMRAFTEDYTVILVTRRSGLVPGYTTRTMADDYAELVRRELGGRVGLVLGASYGGLIAQHFAANYPELLDRLVIAMSGPVVSDQAKQLDLRYAELISQHRDRAAMVVRGKAAFTGASRFFMSPLLWVLGKSLLGPVDETFRRDVVIEARAEAEHDSRDILDRIRVPTLVIGSTEDFAFPAETVEEMAKRIPGARLALYAGGHTAAFLDRRFYPDVRQFAR
jgi:pimeloyl-ACP methyl ester carboxylesterase